jgi:hypothetical protein
MNPMINTGIRLEEFETNPTVLGGGQSLRRHMLACGPSPSVSEAFGATTQFVELTIGFDAHNGIPEGFAIHHEIGLDPLADLIDHWKGGALPTPTIPIANGARVVFPVGPGSRIAVLATSATPAAAP